MGIDVLTLISAFASNACANSVPPSRRTTEDANQFRKTVENAGPSPAGADDLGPANPPETLTTDNKPATSQNEPISRPPQDATKDFRKALKAQTSASVQDDTELKKQGSGSSLPVKAQATEPLANQGRPAAVLAMNVEKLMGIDLETQNRPASSVIGPQKPQQALLNPVSTAKPSSAGPGQASGGASPLQNKPLYSNLSQSQTKPGSILSEGTDNSASAEIKQAAAINAHQTPAPSVRVAKVLASEGNVNGLMPASEGETATDAQESGQTVQSSTQKTTMLDGGLAALNDRLADIGQDESLGPKKAAFFIQESAGGDVDSAQQVQAPISEYASKWARGQSASKFRSDSGNTQSESTSGTSILDRLDGAQIQVSTDQSKGHGSSTTKNDSGSDLPQTFFQSSATNQVVDNSAALRQATKGADNPLPSSGYTGVGEQIRESIYSLASGGDQRITIRLNPPELGYVSIKLVEQADEITGVLEISRTQTRYEIEQVLPEVLRNLADSGVQIKRLDVTLADQSEQQTYKDQSLQDGWASQHNSTEGGSFESKTGNQYVENDYSYQDIVETHQMFVTDNSINMLV